MFIRPHLDYDNIVYDRAFNELFDTNLESVEYNAAIAITGTIRGISSEKLFEELGLESLKSRRWLRKLCLFYKIFHENLPRIFFSYFHQTITSMLQEVLKATKFPVLRPGIIILKILFCYSNIRMK